MQIKVLAFAHARLALGFSERIVEASQEESPRAIVQRIDAKYLPDTSTRVAVNQIFANWDAPIGAADELAIIPMVSGG